MSSRNFTKDKISGIEFRPVTRGEYNKILICVTASPAYDKHNNSLYWDQMRLIDDNKPYHELMLTYNEGKFSKDWEKAYLIFGDTLRNFIKDEETMFKIKQWMFYIITEESTRIINRRTGLSQYDHNLYKHARLQPVLKNKKAQKHFGDILSNLNFNESFRELLESFHEYTPSVQEVQNFRLNLQEQKIVDAIVRAAKKKNGYNVNTEIIDYLESEAGLYGLIKEMFSKYISKIAGNFNFNEDEFDYSEDHAIKNMIRGEIMQPYMDSDVLYNLIYDNPEIDVNDLEGLISSGVRRKGQEAKEYVGKNTSGKINTTLYLFMYYNHKPETVRKVAEVFVKYAILSNFKNTDYMFERSLKPATQKHFGDIFGGLHIKESSMDYLEIGEITKNEQEFCRLVADDLINAAYNNKRSNREGYVGILLKMADLFEKATGFRLPDPFIRKFFYIYPTHQYFGDSNQVLYIKLHYINKYKLNLLLPSTGGFWVFSVVNALIMKLIDHHKRKEIYNIILPLISRYFMAGLHELADIVVTDALFSKDEIEKLKNYFVRRKLKPETDKHLGDILTSL